MKTKKSKLDIRVRNKLEASVDFGQLYSQLCYLVYGGGESTTIEKIVDGLEMKFAVKRLEARKENRVGAIAFSMLQKNQEKRKQAAQLIDLVQGYCDIVDGIVDSKVNLALNQNDRLYVSRSLHGFLIEILGGSESLFDKTKVPFDSEMHEDFFKAMKLYAEQALLKLNLSDVAKRGIMSTLNRYIISQDISMLNENWRMVYLKALSGLDSESEFLKFGDDIFAAEKFFSWNTPLFAYFLIGYENIDQEWFFELEKLYSAYSCVNIALDSLLRIKEDISQGQNNLLTCYISECSAVRAEAKSLLECDHVERGVGTLIKNVWKMIEEYNGIQGAKEGMALDFQIYLFDLMVNKHYGRLLDEKVAKKILAYA